MDMLNQIFQEDLRSSKVFNPRDKSISAKSYGFKGGKKDEYNFQLLLQLAKSLPEAQKLLLGQAGSMISTIAANNRELQDLQNKGNSIYNSLFDGSLEKPGFGSKKESKAAPVFSISKAQKLLIYENL